MDLEKTLLKNENENENNLSNKSINIISDKSNSFLNNIKGKRKDTNYSNHYKILEIKKEEYNRYLINKNSLLYTPGTWESALLFTNNYLLNEGDYYSEKTQRYYYKIMSRSSLFKQGIDMSHLFIIFFNLFILSSFIVVKNILLGCIIYLFFKEDILSELKKHDTYNIDFTLSSLFE